MRMWLVAASVVLLGLDVWAMVTGGALMSWLVLPMLLGTLALLVYLALPSPIPQPDADEPEARRSIPMVPHGHEVQGQDFLLG